MTFMKRTSTKIIELFIVSVFTIMFIGYAITIYPFEQLSKLNPAVKKKRLKHSPQFQ